EASVFRNVVSNYIYYAPTGELDPRFGRFPVFAARGSDAVFEGAEAAVQWELVRRWVLDASASYVRGTRTGDDDPLPAIPPLNGSVGVRYEADAFFLNASWEAAAAQNRVPRPIQVPNEGGELIQTERPTAGYDVVD